MLLPRCFREFPLSASPDVCTDRCSPSAEIDFSALFPFAHYVRSTAHPPVPGHLMRFRSPAVARAELADLSSPLFSHRPPPLPLSIFCKPGFFESKKKQFRMSAFREGDPRIERIASVIRVVPDFPKPGILFQDITTLLLDHKAFKDSIDILVERFKDKNITLVAGIEARGFIFGPPIALAIGAKFVPMRKPMKLPGEVIFEEYELEYGTDRMEMSVGAVDAGDRALVVDDLIATGGTLCAAIRLLERAGAEVVECACIIEIPDLKGREKLEGKPLTILVETK